MKVKGCNNNSSLLFDDGFKKDLSRLFIIGCIIGAIIFLLLYGYKILDFTNVDWIYASQGDRFQHQIGFDFFRDSPWDWPLGYDADWTYPFGTSVVYTDSIPLLAIPFKCFSGFLPNHFQYLGLWGLLSYSLQGGLSCIILRRYVDHCAVILIAVPIFVLAPVLSLRMFVHDSLSAQWIILLAIFICFYKERFYKTKKATIAWSVLCVLSVMIHVYFVIMVGALMIGFLINDYICYKKGSRIIIIAAAAGLSSAGVFWLMGGCVVVGALNLGGLGDFSMNLNAPINRIFEDENVLFTALPTATASNGLKLQYEGLQYLGMGVFIMIGGWLFFKVHGLVLLIRKKKKIRPSNIHHYMQWIVPCVLLTVLSLSPIVTVNDNVLFSYMGTPIATALAPFRATGRFFWPVFYLITFYLVIYLNKKMEKKKYFIVFLAVCCAFQVYDVKTFYTAKSQEIRLGAVYKTQLQSDFWEDASLCFTRIEWLNDKTQTGLNDLLVYAANNGLTVNTGYLARADYEQINGRIENMQNNLLTPDLLKKDSLYVLGLKDQLTTLSYTNDKIVELNIDGYDVVMLRGTIDISKYESQIIPGDSRCRKVKEILEEEGEEYQIDFLNGFRFRISDIAIDPTYESGQSFMVDLTLTNESEQMMPADLYFVNPSGISYQWFDKDNYYIDFNYPRVYLKGELLEGDTVLIHLKVTVPDLKPGKYKLMIDFFQENVAFASDVLNSPYVYEVEIVE